MITTGNTKIKKDMTSGKPGKMITTNKVQPKDYEPKGKPQPRNPEIITTANVGEHLKRLAAQERMAKARDAKRKRK